MVVVAASRTDIDLACGPSRIEVANSGRSCWPSQFELSRALLRRRLTERHWGPRSVIVIEARPPYRVLVAPAGMQAAGRGVGLLLYALLVLARAYVTWLTAWCVLGHRPRDGTIRGPRRRSVRDRQCAVYRDWLKLLGVVGGVHPAARRFPPYAARSAGE